MGTCSFFPLLFMIASCHFGYGDKPYKVINFKIPQAVWRQALQPTPVLKSPITITIPVNVQDDSNLADDLDEDEVPELNESTVESQEPIVPVNDPVPPVVVTQAPPLQDEAITQAPAIPGQVVRLPCQCRQRHCGCCTGTFMERFSMKACGNITFIPEDFLFDVNMNVNNRTVVRRRVSASNPPPICFNPRRAPFVQVCAEISNIQIRNKNVNACLDINANIGDFPVYSASFRCFRFGASGLQTGKKPRPVSSTGPKPVNLFGSSSNKDDGGDDGGGFLENTIFGEGGLFGGGGGEGGLFGGGGGDGGSSNSDDGPFDGIGDAFGDIIDFE